MAIDITIYWAGPADADSGSTYLIERSFDLTNWTELAAGQAATAPHASPATTLASSALAGVTTLALADAGDFASAGHGYVGKALIAWTGKTGDNLTGVTWLSGAGTYAGGTVVVAAHESYTDSAVAGYNYTVFYRITHQNGGLVSPPAFVLHYVPPAPASADHCALLVIVATDASGMTRRAGVSVACYLQDDSAFDPFGGQADANRVPADNTQVTGVDGAAAFQLWRDSALSAATGGTVPAYTVVLGVNEIGSEQTFTLTGIPDDRDWLLLSQVV